MSQTLPDIQKTADTRGLEINEVGVSNIRFPLVLPKRDGGVFNTVGKISMRVNLAHTEKGTHMSRFLIALNENQTDLAPSKVEGVLENLLAYLEADVAYLDMSFPIFLTRKAPVTGIPGLLDFDCLFRGVLTKDGLYEKQVGVEVIAASLCPCSKEISKYGAHNQRSRIQIKVRETRSEGVIWFEDLIDIAERNASCRMHPILKRPDEKYVTESAYENPKFVEDIVRDVGTYLREWLKSEKIGWFHVSSTNYESIHNHDAYAHIEMGDTGTLLGSFSG